MENTVISPYCIRYDIEKLSTIKVGQSWINPKLDLSLSSSGVEYISFSSFSLSVHRDEGRRTIGVYGQTDNTKA